MSTPQPTRSSPSTPIRLQAYAQEIDAKRAQDEPTVPTVLSRELETNPFLRADAPEMQARWGGESPADTFAKLRAAKDAF